VGSTDEGSSGGGADQEGGSDGDSSEGGARKRSAATAELSTPDRQRQGSSRRSRHDHGVV
jgi:hypothetical protein